MKKIHSSALLGIVAFFFASTGYGAYTHSLLSTPLPQPYYFKNIAMSSFMGVVGMYTLPFISALSHELGHALVADFLSQDPSKTSKIYLGSGRKIGDITDLTPHKITITGTWKSFLSPFKFFSAICVPAQLTSPRSKTLMLLAGPLSGHALHTTISLLLEKVKCFDKPGFHTVKQFLQGYNLLLMMTNLENLTADASWTDGSKTREQLNISRKKYSSILTFAYYGLLHPFSKDLFRIAILVNCLNSISYHIYDEYKSYEKSFSSIPSLMSRG
jgi:hypothetical protein